VSRRPVTTTEFLQDYQCSITFEYPFIDPVQVNPCGHLFDKKSFNTYLQGKTRLTCPCCRGDIVLSGDAPSIIKNALSFGLSQSPESYKDVHFDLNHFADVVRKNELNTAIGERFILVLEHADTYLNEAIGTLATTLAGRDLLRQKLNIDAASGKFKFGRAEISAESLQIEVNGKSIREWLSMTTAMEVMQDEEKNVRQAIGTEAQTITLQLKENFQRMLRSQGLFRSGTAAPTDQRPSHPAVNEILQNVVYGNKEAVRVALEALRTENPVLLRTVLIATATQPITDYSNKPVVNQTLLQAAACAGDVAINPGEKEMCEMIASYLPADEVATQFVELFPEGIEAHEEAQKRQSQTDFEPMLQAVKQAILAENSPDPRNPNDPNNNLNATLSKNVTNELYLKIETLFRQPYTALSHREKIFNPYHLLRAFEVYNELWNQLESNGSNRDYKKRDLFWRQIIGFCQRFMPACYTQAFSQGLHYLVKVDQSDSWRPEVFRRDLKLRCDNFSYFPLSPDSRSGLGFDFAIYGSFCIGARACALCRPCPPPRFFSKTYVEQKRQAFRTLRREFE